MVDGFRAKGASPMFFGELLRQNFLKLFLPGGCFLLF